MKKKLLILITYMYLGKYFYVRWEFGKCKYEWVLVQIVYSF